MDKKGVAAGTKNRAEQREGEEEEEEEAAAKNTSGQAPAEMAPLTIVPARKNKRSQSSVVW